MIPILPLLAACVAAAAGCAAYVDMSAWLSAVPTLCPLATGAGAVSLVRLAWLTDIPDLGLSVARTKNLCDAHLVVGEASGVLAHAGFALGVTCILLKLAMPPDAPEWAVRTMSGIMGGLSTYVAARSVQVHVMHVRLLRIEARLAAKAR